MKFSNKGFTSWDKAWLPAAIAVAGLLGYHGIISPEQTDFLIGNAETLITIIAQGALVYFVRNREG